MDEVSKKPSDDESRALVRGGVIDLEQLLRILRAERATFFATIVVCVLLAILFLHVAARSYAVHMVITAANSASTPTGGALDELSSVAGLDLGSSGSPQFKMFVGALRSPFAAEAIAADEDLMKAMFPREWSAAEGKWHEPRGVVSVIGRGVKRALGAYIPWAPPGVSRVADYLKDQLKIVPDSKSGVVNLEIDSRYPAVAERILLTLNHAVDERIRQRALERATTDIGYLTQRLSAVTVEEYRKALVSNLVDQEKQRMLASAPLPYASEALGTTMISTTPAAPVPFAVLTTAFILGGMIGLILARIRYYRRR